jgi:hypothetical protein
MRLRSIQISIVAAVLSTPFLAPGVAQHTRRNHAVTNVAQHTTYTFQGCWTQFQSGPCRDIFRDDQGNYWICKDCGTTGNPTPGKCSQISQAALDRGFWCS